MPIEYISQADHVIAELESISKSDDSPAKRAIACIKRSLEELSGMNNEIHDLRTKTREIDAENCTLRKELSHANEMIDKITKDLQQSEEKQVSYSELKNAFLTIINVFSE